MSEKSNSSQELLSRAYALSNDEETKSLYNDWANTYDETMLDSLGYLTPQNTAKLLAVYGGFEATGVGLPALRK